MNLTHYSENGLNVYYTPNFIDKVEADDYLQELSKLPFFKPTFTIYGKTIQPNRKIYAFGDSDVSYSFSGIDIHPEHWSPLMLHLRNCVEKEIGCTYNYVLLNYYPDGMSAISHHKDNELSLDTTFPIAVLSFGAKRTLEFKKLNCESTLIEIDHGSLYTMVKPTNDLFTHGISKDLSVKEPRISLTFRHLIPKMNPILTTPPLKKVKLDLNTSKSDNMFENDWITKTYQYADISSNYNWNLSQNCYVQIVIEKNNSLRLYIRNFKNVQTNKLSPTKEGVIITLRTWDILSSKMHCFNFTSIANTFIVNNQLLTAYLDEDYCLMQQMFKSYIGFVFKPNGIKLSKDQFAKLYDYRENISEMLIEVMLTKVLPSIISSSTACLLHYPTLEKAKENYFACFKNELHSTLSTVYKYDTSQMNYESLIKTLQSKFMENRTSILLRLNVHHLLNCLEQKCVCYYNCMFFKQYDMSFYNNYFEKIFVN